MGRCLQLAEMGSLYVAPNPLVGSVLVYNDRIIGEGYHERYGEAHAEVNCLNSIKEADRHLIKEATLYVSLEPCAHYGKTPPCADLIVEKGIKKVVIGIRDPFSAVDGKGISKLERAGVEVIAGVLEQECLEINKTFFHFHLNKRPYIILKWAQTANGMIGQKGQRLLISNELSNRVVHKWRAEAMAILVGANTAIEDNPKLSTRLHRGRNALRMLLDPSLRSQPSVNLLSDGEATIVFNKIKDGSVGHTIYILYEGDHALKAVLDYCSKNNITSLLVEGGAATLQRFIDEDAWDEARVITNTKSLQGNIAAPVLKDAVLLNTTMYRDDSIKRYVNKKES